MKLITVNLEQQDKDTFIVRSFRNTTQLTVGQQLTRKQIERWQDIPQVNWTITGEQEEKQLKLV